MKYNREIAELALECCNSSGRDNCKNCPIKDECESSPFESVIAKYALALVKELKSANKELDTYKTYAYNMQELVEDIRKKEDAGYTPTAARIAAEMDMWRRVSLQQEAQEQEIARLNRKIFELSAENHNLRTENLLLQQTKDGWRTLCFAKERTENVSDN